MIIRDIAIKEVYCADPTTSLEEIASMMKRHGIGAIPLCEGDILVGMITDRDIVISCVAAGMDAETCQAYEFMTEDPITVTPDTEVEEAARIMAREQIHRLPVVEDGRLVGMVSLGNISLALIGDENLVAETLRKISTPA